MGLRGPAPKPTALKLLEGRPVSKKKKRQEKRISSKAPDCPEWLNDYAKAEWARLAPELERLGLLTEADMAAFACYCQACADLRTASEVLKKEGRIITTPKGYKMPRPEVAMANRAMKVIREFSVQFGLTPSARSRVDILPGKGSEDLD
jgi:P27 family predicted phage terminase small subunit